MAQVEHFDRIYQRALARKGGERQLQQLLGQPASTAELLAYQDADWLSAMSKKIFQSGFVWRVVEQSGRVFARFFLILPSKKFC